MIVCGSLVMHITFGVSLFALYLFKFTDFVEGSAPHSYYRDIKVVCKGNQQSYTLSPVELNHWWEFQSITTTNYGKHLLAERDTVYIPSVVVGGFYLNSKQDYYRLESTKDLGVFNLIKVDPEVKRSTYLLYHFLKFMGFFLVINLLPIAFDTYIVKLNTVKIYLTIINLLVAGGVGYEVFLKAFFQML